jgi:hypothetical protein
MRLFQVLDDGDFREVVSETVRESGGMSGVYEAVAVARQLKEDGTFVADYGDGQVLRFQVSNDSAIGVRPENIRNLPIERTPARLADIQAGSIDPQTEDQLSNFGAMYHAVKEEDIGGANAMEEL